MSRTMTPEPPALRICCACAFKSTTRRSAVDARTTRHPGYAASQRVRKRIEEAFGWMKTIGGMRRPMLRGTDRVGWAFTFAAAAYNLVCLPRLLKQVA